MSADDKSRDEITREANQEVVDLVRQLDTGKQFALGELALQDAWSSIHAVNTGELDEHGARVALSRVECLVGLSGFCVGNGRTILGGRTSDATDLEVTDTLSRYWGVVKRASRAAVADTDWELADHMYQKAFDRAKVEGGSAEDIYKEYLEEYF